MNTAPKQYTIDATGKALGRVASEVAALLRGKSQVDFAPNKVPNICVTVEHVGQVKFTGNKFATKVYERHTGHPGGFKREPFARLWEQSPVRVAEKMVARMLPKNKLRKEMLKHLTITV